MSNKQTSLGLLFTSDTINDKNYPKSRISLTLVNNKGEITNKQSGEVIPYDSNKIKIISSKLGIRDGQTIVKTKGALNRNGEPYSKPDEQFLSIEIEELITLLNNKEQIISELEELLK